MAVEPGTGAVTLAVQSIRALFGAYNAYADGKVRETDDGIREDLRRRVNMIRDHLTNIEGRAVERGAASMIREIARATRVLDALSDDIRMGPHGSTGVVHTDADPVKRRMIQDLIKHDKAVYERLMEATRAVNEAEELMLSNVEEATVKVAMLEQRLTSVRNRYQQRVALLGGF